MGDQDSYFRSMDAALKHPSGQAKGGEPCIICSNPIPRTAHWKQRDRHVCSSNCNERLRRRYRRGSPTIDASRVAAAIAAAGPKPNPRISGPRVFRTIDEPETDRLPIEWEGYGPLPGDIVERYGVVTMYEVRDMPEDFHTSRVIIAYTPEAEQAFMAGATAEGHYSSLVIGPITEEGLLHGQLFTHKFLCQGVLCEWRRERVTDLHLDGVDRFYWDCWAAVPVDAPRYPEPMHSPRYRAEMDRRRRLPSNTAKQERRARAEARVEHFDPLEVYERDGWMCRICGSEIDRAVLRPDPLSASLDHVVPLSRGGDHTQENSVPAHLRCNIRKSAE